MLFRARFRIGGRCRYVLSPSHPIPCLFNPPSLTLAPQGDYSITKPHAAGVFYNDLPEADQQYWYAKTSTHSFGTKTAKATAASWKEIPTGYLLCEEDIPIPPFAQELMTGQVREMGGEIEITRIKSGHSPFLSRVDETVAWIRRAAGEDV